MGQEFFIKDANLEQKVRELLPSQGGAGAGFDLSASTQIIPIVDLTESAEGSNLRADLQNSISFTGATGFLVNNTTQSIITNTGYWRIYGTMTGITSTTSADDARIIISDGATDKIIWRVRVPISSNNLSVIVPIDFIAYLEAGHSLKMFTGNANLFLGGSTRQIASIDGTLTNP